MRQGAQDICHWDNSTDDVIGYQLTGLTMESNIADLTSKTLIYQSGSESSLERSGSEGELDTENPSNDSERCFLKLRSIYRKNSDCSSTSSLLDCSSSSSSSESTFSEDSKASDDTGITTKYDDIIEKIVELKFSGEKKGESVEILSEDVNANWEVYSAKSEVKLADKAKMEEEEEEEKKEEKKEDVDTGDSELIARGPVRPQSSESYRPKPYPTLDDWLEDAVGIQSYSSDIDSTAQQILSNQEYSRMINPALDRLEGHVQNSYSIPNDWPNVETHSYLNNVDGTGVASIPSIKVTENALEGEELLMEILDLKGFQSAQSDTTSIATKSPMGCSDHWPDSPASAASYNIVSSRSQSRASSGAQSPGSANIGSPLVPISLVGSPPDSFNRRSLRRLAMSSSSSSNHSFGDAPSPANYRYSVDGKLEDQLGRDFGNFSTWCNGCESSETIVNSSSNVDNLENWCKNYDSTKTFIGNLENSDDIHSRLQMLEEVIKDDLDEIQVVPKYMSTSDESSGWRSRMRSKITAKQKQNSGCNLNGENCPNLTDLFPIENSMKNQLIYPEQNIYNYPQNLPNSTETTSGNLGNFMPSNYSRNIDENQYQSNSSNMTNNSSQSYGNFRQNSPDQTTSRPSASTNQVFGNSWCEVSSTFNNFQVPQPVSSYRQKYAKRNSEKNATPWSSLNMPSNAASKKLKEGIDRKKVAKAMQTLLKKSPEELASCDADGDTMLMCLVGDPAELSENKAYLVPLVERMSTISDALSRMNNRGEDALYLAAMNCPEMSYVTGYLGAVMLQRGIDIAQRLYQTRGDTLVHAVAANGDTHKQVLAELLALKTAQGNTVFDLSQCNYNGRTPLHVAVESHDPSGSGVNSLGIIRLLLRNGADPKIREINHGNTALHLAVSLHCEPTLIKELLAMHGTEAVNIRNHNHETPLHIAAVASERIRLYNQMEVCRSLISAGGLTNIENHRGQAPLDLVIPPRTEYIKNILS